MANAIIRFRSKHNQLLYLSENFWITFDWKAMLKVIILMVDGGDFSFNTVEAQDKRYYKLEFFRQIFLHRTALANSFLIDISEGCSPLNNFKDVYSDTSIVWKSCVTD